MSHVSQRLARPDMPAAAGRAHEVLSTTIRVTVLQYLLQVPSTTRNQIAEATGMSAASARLALLDLERIGYVVADARQRRSGVLVHYRAIRQAFADDLEAFTTWMLGQLP